MLYHSVKAVTTNTVYELWLDRFAKYGHREIGSASHGYTVEFDLLGMRVVLTAEPDNIKALLATQFSDYGKGEPFHEKWKDFLGDSIFTTDLQQWHDSRQLIRPQFIKDRVTDLEIFEEHVAELIDQMGGRGQEVDVAALFLRYTLDASTHFLLGRSVDSLKDPRVEFAEAFGEVQRIQSQIESAGPLAYIMPRGRFNKGLKTINEFVNPFIDEALRLSPGELDDKTRSDDGYTFLHALACFTRDRKVIRDQLVAILLAGRDTTAGTLSWMFYELSRHPEAVVKLRREIIETVGSSRPPTYEDLKSMKYLRHAINETLRLYPAVPINVRLALKDTTLPYGGGPNGDEPIGILKDTPIGYAPLVMQRRADLYPPPSPDFPPVDVFSPERWDNWIPKSWHYVPFNGGPRICIGQQFALTEIGYTIVRILQRFETVDTRMADNEQFMTTNIVLQPGAGVRVGLWESEKR
ncbi:MAG: hypothetical protein M1827_006319 [Pycnora praestabilis]|nr:MAG: hypothetical protein M1827_006319 [Pycnora praestabilis]